MNKYPPDNRRFSAVSTASRNFLFICALTFTAIDTSRAEREPFWLPPNAKDINAVSVFPRNFLRNFDVTLSVSKELIVKFVKEGKILDGSRKADVLKLGKLSLASGTLLGEKGRKDKVNTKAKVAPYGLAGLVAADGVIITRTGEFFFYEMLNDNVLALYKDPEEKIYSLKDNENRIFLMLPSKNPTGDNDRPSDVPKR